MSSVSEGPKTQGRLRGYTAWAGRLILAAACLGGALYLISGGSVLGGRHDPTGQGVEPPVDAGPEAAERVVERLRDVRAGRDSGSVELTSAELTALLRHALTGMVPAGVEEPSVRVVRDELHIWARVSPELLPSGHFLTETLENLPAVADVEVRGRLIHASDSEVEYRIEDVFVERVSLPDRLVEILVSASGGLAGVRAAEDGLRAGATTPDEGRIPPAFRARWPLARGRITVSDGVVRIDPVEPKSAEQVDGSTDS